MGIKGHETRDIFADFRTHVFPPVSAAWFKPKIWGIAVDWDDVTGTIHDPTAFFVTNNTQIGDAVYRIYPEPDGGTVTFILDNFWCSTTAIPSVWLFEPCLYKLGHLAPHTLQSLATILDDRGLTYYTIKQGKLWTGAHVPDWNLDETGEVYVISHDTGKALWLDGEIDLPVGFPERDRPAEPLPIAQWEDRFPGQPRPDYPPGLEPGAALRDQLVEQHGSLLAAHDAKSKVEK